MRAEKRLNDIKRDWENGFLGVPPETATALAYMAIPELIATIETVLVRHQLVSLRDGIYGCKLDGFHCETRMGIDEALEIEL